MINNFNFTLIFYAVTLLCLISDLGQFFTLGHVAIPLLLCIYTPLLFYHLQKATLIFVTLLLCVESFCICNNPLFPLMYLIPLIVCVFYVKKHFYHNFFYPMIFVVACSTVHCAQNPNYTALQFCVIILVGICFSLIIKYWGMLDNRAQQ